MQTLGLRPAVASFSRPQSIPPLAARRVSVVTRAYAAPSTAPAATELEELSRISCLVPDTRLLEESVGAPIAPQAATVSCAVLRHIVNSGFLGIRPYQNAVSAALLYDKCSVLASPEERESCTLDKALVNVGALFAAEVAGRVCTEVDPRVVVQFDNIVAKVHQLIEMYGEVGVPQQKLIFRLPATWDGIQAASLLEKEGIATQVILVHSLVQGVAAAQAGVSIVTPNVGRTRDWFNKNPGVVRDPKGPREDSGFTSTVDPGTALAQQLYLYCKKYAPHSAVMASGLRTKQDVLALAGCDYLVLDPRIIKDLAGTTTIKGYNDGLHAGQSTDDDGLERVLSPEIAAESVVLEAASVSRATFNEQLGSAGRELLDQGLAGLMDDVQSLLPAFKQMAASAE